MINKIKHLKNLAVFKDFNWDAEVKNESDEVIEFKKTNIIYGRNYSGKTTLSRVLRAMETGVISDKYENAECCICITENDDVIQTDFTLHDKVIRVFNDDFIKHNLKFINNSDENVQPFAILGGDNNVIEEEIKALKEKLGSDEEEKETALYKDLKTLDTIFNTANQTHSRAETTLATQLNDKAIGNTNGIKYNSEKFGDINYTNAKLKRDINAVKSENYTPISDEEKILAEKILLEQSKQDIPELEEIKLSFEEFSRKAKELVTKPITQANKLEDLVKDAILNKWVKEGRELHKDNLDTCAFCNNEINETRWEELEIHFDEESDKLEKEIINLIININSEIELFNSIELIKKEDFYTKYNDEFDGLKVTFDNSITEYQDSLGSLIS